MEGFLNCLENHGIDFAREFCLARVSAMRLGGSCTAFIRPATEEELEWILSQALRLGIKYKIVGRMTNILPSDDEYDGVIISTSKLSSYSVAENVLEAQCGAMLSKLAVALARRGLGGISQLSGIPGTVGGMIYSNAGAYGLEISDVFIDSRVYDISAEKELVLDKTDMEFSYRHSLLRSGKYALLSARFSLSQASVDTVLTEIRELGERRRKKQPLDMPSLGSAFLRPPGHFAAKLIDDAGLRGLRVGGASVSMKHAGFIVNSGGATAADVRSLIRLVQDCVMKKYGVELIPEIEFL